MGYYPLIPVARVGSSPTAAIYLTIGVGPARRDQGFILPRSGVQFPAGPLKNRGNAATIILCASIGMSKGCVNRMLWVRSAFSAFSLGDFLLCSRLEDRPSPSGHVQAGSHRQHPLWGGVNVILQQRSLRAYRLSRKCWNSWRRCPKKGKAGT